MTPEERIILINLLIEKSELNLQQAKANAQFGYWDLVANRLYYSVFHSVNALLLSEGIKATTHKGASSQFGKYFVLNGKFNKEDGILYSRLQFIREKADYNNIFSLPKEEGEKYIDRTERLQKKIIDYIKRNNNNR